MKCVNLFH